MALVLHLVTGLVSPQFHVVLDEEFSTVDYLTSTTPPPNWSTLLRTSTIKTSPAQELKSLSWLYPSHAQSGPISEGAANTANKPVESTRDTTVSEGVPISDIVPDTTVPEGASVSDTVTDTSSSNTSRRVRFASDTNTRRRHAPPSAHATPATHTANHHSLPPAGSFSQSTHPRDVPETAREETSPSSAETTFVNLDTLGLRRSPRIAALPTQPNYTFLTLAFAALLTQSVFITEAATSCFQTNTIRYKEFLDECFDGSSNSHHPMANIYLSTKSNNEVYTLKEMLRQPDKDQFVEAMRLEVKSLFAQKIWETVSKTTMYEHYKKLEKQGKPVKRHQIMMIWSFKRKRHPDGSLQHGFVVTEGSNSMVSTIGTCTPWSYRGHP